MTMGQTVFIKTTTKIALQIIDSRVWLKPYHLRGLTCKDVAASASNLANQASSTGFENQVKRPCEPTKVHAKPLSQQKFRAAKFIAVS